MKMNWTKTRALLVFSSLALCSACSDDNNDESRGAMDAGSDAAPTPDAGSDAAPTPDAGSDAAPTPDAGSDAATDAGSEALEIEGRYTTNFDDAMGNPLEEEITSTSWDLGYGGEPLAIVEYDNDENVVYASGPDFSDPMVTVFSKIVWTEPGADGSFFYCTVVPGSAATLEEAKASTETADASDPSTGGCAMFPWTLNTPKA